MAEPTGRAARWTAAALAAPVVAGVFAGATAWATRVDPLHSAGTGAADVATPGPTTTSTTDPAVEALRRQLVVQQLAMNRLADKVAAVRAKANALARQNAAGSLSATGATGSAGSSGGSLARSSGSGSSSRSAAATRSSSSSGSSHTSTSAPAPAPPPPTHGSTGASGSG